MQTSTHYNLNLVEGTDLVNPLTVDKPNYEAIDSAMYDNECSAVGSATELKTGTVHALTRVKSNQNVFRFRATSIFEVGDTFTVDGNSVTALYSDGSSLSDHCFIIGSDVLCALIGTQLTLFSNKQYDASEISYKDTNVENGIDSKANASSIAMTVTNPTSVSITNGSHFMLDGVRYKATTTISAGASIQLGTNCIVESVEDDIKGKLILNIPANTYNTWALALTALESAYNGLTSDEKKRSCLVWSNHLVFRIEDLVNVAFVNTSVRGTPQIDFRSFYLTSHLYLIEVLYSGTLTKTDSSGSPQDEAISLYVL